MRQAARRRAKVVVALLFILFCTPHASADESPVVTLALVGDVLPMYVTDPFRDDGVRSVLRGAGIAFGNLEGPISSRGSPNPIKFHNGRLIHNEFLFRVAPAKLASLRNGGFDVVSLANNHMMDYGLPALHDTWNGLRKYGILHAGAGSNLAGARRPAIVERRGLRVAFLAYVDADTLPTTRNYAATEDAAGLAFLYQNESGHPTAQTLAMVRDDVQNARRQADLVAVSFHWGHERDSRPNAFQRRLARHAVDAGANVIIGAHSHCLQGVEIYKNSPIFYSLGNFVFRGFDALTRRTGIASLEVDRNGVRRVLFRPAWIRNRRPYLTDGRRATRTAQRVLNLSRELGATPLLARQNGRPVAVFDLRHKQQRGAALSLDGVLPMAECVGFSTIRAVKPSPSTEFVEATAIVPNLRVDLPYASTDNFFKTRFYQVNRAFLRRGTAVKLRRAQRALDRYGLRLKIWDAYRPLSVQRQMWQQVPDTRYVAPPGGGSHHNRGAAVDVTLVDKHGREVAMPTGFDDFSPRAAANFPHPSQQVRRHRFWLRQAMLEAGFRPLSTEWWHFSDSAARQYSLSDIPLTQLAKQADAGKRQRRERSAILTDWPLHSPV